MSSATAVPQESTPAPTDAIESVFASLTVSGDPFYRTGFEIECRKDPAWPWRSSWVGDPRTATTYNCTKVPAESLIAVPRAAEKWPTLTLDLTVHGLDWTTSDSYAAGRWVASVHADPNWTWMNGPGGGHDCADDLTYRVSRSDEASGWIPAQVINGRQIAEDREAGEWSPLWKLHRRVSALCGYGADD